MSSTTFSIIKTKELSELGSHKPSGCAVLIYTALCSFSRNKATCFPSVGTLAKAIGGAFSTRSIQRALLFLETIKFIKRNEKKSKERFVMLKRIGRICRDTLTGQKRRNNRKKEKYSFYKRRDTKNNYSSKQTKSLWEEDKPSKVSQAEAIYGDWVYKTNGEDLKALSKENLSIIGDCLRSHREEDIEWREVMWESQSARFLKIKQLTAVI